MLAATRKMADLKNEILAKIDETFREFKTDFINEIKDQIKNEVREAIGVEIRKREELESTVAVLQQHVKNFHKQMMVLQSENEELEQYGRRLCIRVEGGPTNDNETSEEVLKKVQSLINEAECDIPYVAIDRAHRIGNGYKDRKTNTLCKSIIVRFTTFRHRTMFYRNRNKLKNNAKVKLDLTRKRYMTFTRALESVKKVSIVDYAMVDINYRLKVVFKSGRSKFFTDDDSLNEAVEQERIQ